MTHDLTILIGENESGKTSLLDALACFNLDQDFQNADLSTMSPTRESVLSGMIGKDTIDMVTITIRLSDNERERLKIPASVLAGDLLRVTKRLDNSYVIKGVNGTPISELFAGIKNNRLLTEIKGIRRQLGSVYQGYIGRKFPQDQFVFLRRSEDDPEASDLILFPSDAGELWEELHQGDIVQVTHQAPDPYGRNARAMNVGKHMDFDEELDAVVSTALLEAHEFDSALQVLLSHAQEIPANHPLRSILSDEFQMLLNEQIAANSDQTPWDDNSILLELPVFERGVVSSLSDKLPLDSEVGPPDIEDTNRGFQALIDEVGLKPAEAVVAEHTDRVRIFDEKSKRLSEIFTASWVKDVHAEFVPFNQDKEIGLAISCQGSLDPPSRRSQGFNSYLGLTARLLEIGRDSNSKTRLLLDDPAMHLHPTAQEKLAEVLSKQQYQVLAATHFPFMIRPDRLDRVRMLCRTEAGAYLEDDWRQAGDGLLPMRGALSRWTLGRIPVLVEGESDREVLVQMSELLKRSGQDSMSPIIEPLPVWRGPRCPTRLRRFRAMGVKFIALVDGDRQGDDIRRRHH